MGKVKFWNRSTEIELDIIEVKTSEIRAARDRAKIRFPDSDDWQARYLEIMLIPAIQERWREINVQFPKPTINYIEPNRDRAGKFGPLPGYIFTYGIEGYVWNSIAREDSGYAHSPSRCWDGVRRETYKRFIELLDLYDASNATALDIEYKLLDFGIRLIDDREDENEDEDTTNPKRGFGSTKSEKCDLLYITESGETIRAGDTITYEDEITGTERAIFRGVAQKTICAERESCPKVLGEPIKLTAAQRTTIRLIDRARFHREDIQPVLTAWDKWTNSRETILDKLTRFAVAPNPYHRLGELAIEIKRLLKYAMPATRQYWHKMDEPNQLILILSLSEDPAHAMEYFLAGVNPTAPNLPPPSPTKPTPPPAYQSTSPAAQEQLARLLHNWRKRRYATNSFEQLTAESKFIHNWRLLDSYDYVIELKQTALYIAREHDENASEHQINQQYYRLRDEACQRDRAHEDMLHHTFYDRLTAAVRTAPDTAALATIAEHAERLATEHAGYCKGYKEYSAAWVTKWQEYESTFAGSRGGFALNGIHAPRIQTEWIYGEFVTANPKNFAPGDIIQFLDHRHHSFKIDKVCAKTVWYTDHAGARHRELISNLPGAYMGRENEKRIYPIL